MDASGRVPYVGAMRRSLLVMMSLISVGCHQRVVVAPPTLPPAIPRLDGPEQIVLALRYIDATVGTGPVVGSRQCVYVHYTGWLRDGTKFDSSRDTMPNGTPRTPIGFPLGVRRVIAGWDLSFDGMHVGSKRRLFIPYPLAYGESGRPPVIPPKSELIFDLELMAVADTVPTAEVIPQRGPSPQCPTWATVKDRPAAP